jgi:hypothetical protein
VATTMISTTCQVLKDVSRKRRLFWITFLLWWIGVALFVFAVSHFFKNAADAFITVPFYLSILILYIPVIALYRVKCPFCHGSVGAVPFFRYSSVSCRKCGKRIECKG